MSEIVIAYKRLRGRPRGTGIDDGATLDSVADLIVASPGLKPSTAMKRAVQAIKDSHLRRLQDKWKQESDARLIAARKRAQQKAAASERQARAAREAYVSVPSYSESVGPGDINRLLGLVDTPITRAMRQLVDSPAVAFCKEMTSMNSQVREAMGLVDHSGILSVREQHDAVMRSMLPSDAMAAVQDWQKLHEAVQPKWLQHHQRLMDRLNPLGRYRR